MRLLLKLVRFWSLLLAVLLCGYLAIHNKEPVAFTLPPWIEHVTMPAYLALSLAFLAGSAVTIAFLGGEFFVKTWQLRALRKQLSEIRRDSRRPAADESEGRLEPVAGIPIR